MLTIPYNWADNRATKKTHSTLLNFLKPFKKKKRFWTPAALLQCQDTEDKTCTVVLHSFLQVTGGSSVQSGWNSKPLALSTSVETLFPPESKAILIRNRNTLRDLSPNLFLVYLGYLKFILPYNQALLHSSGFILKGKKKTPPTKNTSKLLPPRIYPQT